MSIHKRINKKGKIKYDIYYYDSHGRQRCKTFDKLSDARRFASLIAANKIRGEMGLYELKKILFEVFAWKWLGLHSKVNKALSSHIRDIGVVNQHLNPFFGGMYLNAINEEMVNRYILQRRGQKTARGTPPADNTVNRELEILSKILNSAVEWGYLQRLPLKRVRKLHIQRKEVEPLSQKEVRRLLDNTDSFDKPLFACAVYTGARLGELLNLKKSCVDLVKGFIRIETGSSITNMTKGKKVRYVPINESLRPYLEDAMKNEGELIFPSKFGGMRKDIRKALMGAAKRAGIKKHVHPHLLRHTFASHYVMSGGDLYSLKEILGHADLSLVQRYSHLSPEYLKASIEKLKY